MHNEINFFYKGIQGQIAIIVIAVTVAGGSIIFIGIVIVLLLWCKYIYNRLMKVALINQQLFYRLLQTEVE